MHILDKSKKEKKNQFKKKSPLTLDKRRSFPGDDLSWGLQFLLVLTE